MPSFWGEMSKKLKEEEEKKRQEIYQSGDEGNFGADGGFRSLFEKAHRAMDNMIFISDALRGLIERTFRIDK